MTVEKMNAFMESILTLHQSARQHSQRMLPKVLLRRLSSNTIQKYTKKHIRFHSTDDQAHISSVSLSIRVPFEKNIPSLIDESPRKDEDLPVTQSKNYRRTDALSVDGSTSAFTSLKLPSMENEGNKGESEDISDVSESETESSCNSDNLPDLNDPSWGKEERKKKTKVRRKKRRNTLKTHPKLMKNARKAFEHKASLYKLSKEFMRNSKAAREIENSESRSYYKDKMDNNFIIKASDQNLSNTVPQLYPSRPVTTAPLGKNLAIESSHKSNAEVMNLNTKESLAKYTEHDKANSQSEYATNSGLESVNTLDTLSSKEKANDQDERPEVVLDSDESDATVIFEESDIKDICHIESVHSLSVEFDDSNSATFVENVKKQKRKDSSFGISNSDVANKKLRKDQQFVHAQKNDINEHPMVIIPVNVTSQQYCSDKLSCSVPTFVQTHNPQQSQCSVMASYSGNRTHIEDKENSPTSIEGKEASKLHSHMSTASIAEIAQSNVQRQVTEKRPECPASASQEESTHVNSHTSNEINESSAENSPLILYNSLSCEDGSNSDKDVCVTGQVSGEAVDQNQTSNRLNLVAASSVIKVDDQEKDRNLKKVAVSDIEKPWKSLSLQFKELTTKRTELEDEISQVKEEFNKKLETLEEQKKKFDLDIKKLIDAMSAWKELSEGDQLPPRDEQVTDTNSTVSTGQPASQVSVMSQHTAAPTQTSPNTSVVAQTVSSSANSSAVVNSLQEKVAINIIPAASIRNFGSNKPTLPEAAALPAGSFPRINLMRIRGTDRMVPQAPATVFSSQNGSRDFPSTSGILAGIQPRSEVSVIDQPSPPNVVVLPGQQHPVSSHMVCRMPPCPPTMQRCVPVGQMEKPSRHSNPGSLHVAHRPSQGKTTQNLSSHLQQNSLYTSVQLQKQKQHQMQQQQQHQQHYQQQQHHQQQQQQLKQQQQHQQQLKQQQQHQHQQQQKQQPRQQHQQQQQQQSHLQQQQQQQQPHLQQQQQQQQPHLQQQQQQQQPNQQQKPQQQQPQLQQQQQHQPQLQQQHQLRKQKMQYQQQQFKQNQQQQQQQQQSQNQKQQVSFQPSSNTQLAEQHHSSQPYMQQYQQGQGQFPSNAALLKGAAPVGYSSPVNSSNSDNWTNAQVVTNIPLASHITTSSPSRIIVAYPQNANSSVLNRDTSSENTPNIVSVPSMTLTATPINYVHHVQPFTSEAGDKVIGLSLPSVSNISVPNSTNRLLSVEATHTPSSNRNINQLTGVTLPAPAPDSLGLEEASEPICKMCGLTGIFTCCGDIIYCSTVCQRNDWTNHQQNCTNTSTPDGS